MRLLDKHHVTDGRSSSVRAQPSPRQPGGLRLAGTALAVCAALVASHRAMARLHHGGKRPAPVHRPVPAAKARPAPRNLLPDGATLVNAHGTLLFNRNTRRWRVEFAPRKPGWPRGMALLPCLMLQGFARSGAKPTRVTVSGEVTRFHGHNYLLISPAAGAGGHVGRRRARAAPPLKAAKPVKLSRPAASANDLLNNLLSHDVSQPVMPAPESHAAPHGLEKVGSSAAPLLREGDYVANRMARVLPAFRRATEKGKRAKRPPAGGYYELIFDSDGRGLHDPPLRLLPCHLLSKILQACHDGKLPRRFRVSGLVTQYRGRDYLLLTFVERPLRLRRF